MPSEVGKYILEREIGKGAMGSVWLSQHPGLGIPVAVKILDYKLAREDPDFHARFIKEGRLAASLTHHNIIRIFDAGTDGELCYLVMEYVEGMDAGELLKKRGALPPEEVLELGISAAEALKQAHSLGIVHRDIKPDNILVTLGGEIKIADMGIAKKLDDQYNSTLAGTVIGTPYYIAPEQAKDASTVDHRCDIYSLGATLYHLITGTLPFSGSNSMNILMMHCQDPLDHPRERKADLPDNICNVIIKMMEKNPDDRYQDCEVLLKALNQVKYNPGKPAPPKSKQFKAPVKVVNNKSRKASSKAKVKQSSKIPYIVSAVVVIVILAIVLTSNSEKPSLVTDAENETNGSNENTEKPKVREKSGTVKRFKSDFKGVKAYNLNLNSRGFDKIGKVSEVESSRGRSLQFEGLGSYLVSTNLENLELRKTPFSISLWVKPNRKTTKQQMLIGKNVYRRNWREWSVLIDSEGLFKFMVYKGGNWHILSSTTTMQDKIWYHIVVTTSAKGDASIYINGKREAQGGGFTFRASPSPVFIGAVKNAGQFVQQFNGLMNRINIFHSQLSKEQVALLVNKK
jgi:serine/threonine protein kinase